VLLIRSARVHSRITRRLQVHHPASLVCPFSHDLPTFQQALALSLWAMASSGEYEKPPLFETESYSHNIICSDCSAECGVLTV
jgi:hypothetical protein